MMKDERLVEWSLWLYKCYSSYS